MKPQAWLCTCILVASLAKATPQAPVTVKTWTFVLAHGTLAIELQLLPDGQSSLRIAPVGKGIEAPIAEQVEPLKRVLLDKLSYLSTRILGQDVREKLGYACVDSRDWHMSMQNKGKNKEQIVIALLNDSGAYEPYNEVFNTYGIRVQVTEAEKVSLMYFSSLPRRNSRDRSYGGTRVPADATLGMRFSKVDSTD
jgi:hypothetical protein